MINFIKHCSKYVNGKLSKRKIERLWVEAITDGRKYELLIMYLLLHAYMKKRPK